MDEKDMTKFFKLIDKVKKIDNNAALHLLNIVNDHKISVNVCLENTDNLGDAFVWSKSPQGFMYWSNICFKLISIEENNEKI